MIATEIILHHFDDSPFSEKIRLAFGIKGLAWRSVRVSPTMPRPDLMPLTGGYRRTPTMQIGADVYCDTAIILREIEARWPEPPLLTPGFEGLVAMTSLWSDRAFFQNTVTLIFGLLGDRVPQAFIDDRRQLRGGHFDVDAMKAAAPRMRDQFRAHCDWIETQLAGRQRGLLGDYGLADVNAYMNVWYVLRRLDEGEALLAEFPRVRGWAARLDAIPSNAVVVTPDDYGRIPVAGEIVSLSRQHIAIRRRDEIAGEIVVHFPRAGFLVADA